MFYIFLFRYSVLLAVKYTFLITLQTEETVFRLGSSGKTGTLALHYDLPLTPYPVSCTPWFMNTTKKRKDSFGQTYLE